MGYRAGRGVSAVIRIGLTDDEPLLTAGLAMLLGAQGDMEVVWQAADGHQALRRAESDPVDVLLLDIQMPGLDGLDTTRRLVSGGAQGRIIILTTFDTDGYVLGAIEAGAAGFLLKSTAPEQLVEAVRTVHAGDSVISPGPTRRLLGAVRRGAPQPGAAGPAARAGAGTRRPYSARASRRVSTSSITAAATQTRSRLRATAMRRTPSATRRSRAP